MATYLILIFLLCTCGFITCDIGPRNPLLETVSYLNDVAAEEDGKVHVSLAQTQLLIDTIWSRAGCGRDLDPVLCKKCLQAPELFEILGANTTIGLEEHEFQQASVILLYHLENAICKTPVEIARTYMYVDYLYDLVTTTQLDVTQTEVGGKFSQSWGRVRGQPGGTLVGYARSNGRKRQRRLGGVRVLQHHRRPAPIQSIVSLPMDLSFPEEQLDYILHLISQTYKASTQYKCFSAADIFEEAKIESGKEAEVPDIERLSSIVIANVLHGYCIGESKLVSPDEFIRSVFEDYGTFGSILKRDFHKLLDDLEIGTHDYNYHAHNEHQKSYEKTPIIVQKKRRKRRSAVGAAAVQPSLADPKKWRQEHNVRSSGCFSGNQLLDVFDIHESISVSKFYDMCPAFIQQLTTKACADADHLYHLDQSVMIYGWGTLAVFLVTLGSMIGIVIVPLAGVRVYTGLMHLLIALAVSTLSGDALLHLIPEVLLDDNNSLENFILNLLLHVDLYIIHWILKCQYRSYHKNVFELWVQRYKALGKDSGSAGAVLRRTSLEYNFMAMGIHVHGVDKPATPQEILNKVILVVAAIYAFFLFERLMVVCLGRAPLTHSINSLNKMDGYDPRDPKAFTAGNSFEVIDDIQDIPEFNDFDNLDRYSVPPPNPKPEADENTNEIKAADPDTALALCTVRKPASNGKPSNPYLTDTLEGRILEESKKMMSSTSTTFSFLRGMQATSVLVLIGDAIHNLADGIAIGVGFTLDGYVGTSITIAVFCHELPHEIGDFSVLLKHGMSFRTAFFWSLMSNIFGFLGLYIGIALGSSQTLHQWIFAATAGLFLYISLVDLMPEITHDPTGFNCPAFFMHNVGLILGWTLMMVLAYFEETMQLT